MKKVFSRVLAFAARNERHLGAIAFVLGFAFDIIAFTLLPVTFVNVTFLGYLVLASIAITLSHLYPKLSDYASLGKKSISVISPLVAQYFIGSLLSGFMIFYTKSATLSVAWPFLLVLALVFVGNEYFRTYYKYLAFQLTLLYFSVYAYLIFALPLFLLQLGPSVFLLSTLLALTIFALYLWLLTRIKRGGLQTSIRPTLISVLVSTLVLSGAYVTGLVPPIPLALTDYEIAHTLTHSQGHYIITVENAPRWFEFYKERVVNISSGETLIAFSAVSAPTQFRLPIVHKWQRYDPYKKEWVTRSTVSFEVSGGRVEGYRGYSEVPVSSPGHWRVSVETSTGQVIGRIAFTVVETSNKPLLTTEYH